MSSTQLNLQAITLARQARFNPLRDFTPEKLTSAIQDFRGGRLGNLARIMDAIEETDDVLGAVIPKAKAAVARKTWEILTVNTADASQEALALRQKEVLEHFYNNLRATSATDQDEVGGVSLLIRQMMDAKGKRYAVHNIEWQPDGAGRYTARFWFTPLWFFENTTGRMRYIETAFGIDGIAMDERSWLVTKGTGVTIACSVAWMFKHLPLKDWLIYSERFGMPGIEGVTTATYGTPEWTRMVEAVEAAGRNFTWVRNQTEAINKIEFGSQGTLPYPALVERMDRALSALWRGADLSTISAGQGQGQGASLQAGEAELIEEDDASWISEILQMKIDRLVLDMVFGEGTPALAYFKIPTPVRDTTQSDLLIDKFAWLVGHPISKKQFAERYNRPLPDPDDELLGRASTPPPPSSTTPTDASAPVPASNEAAMARDFLHKATSLQALDEARRKSLEPLIERVAKLEAAADPDAYASELRTLSQDLPALFKQVAKDPQLATAFEEILGSAMASGIAQKTPKTANS